MTEETEKPVECAFCHREATVPVKATVTLPSGKRRTAHIRTCRTCAMDIACGREPGEHDDAPA